jgi:hypothetical protein
MHRYIAFIPHPPFACVFLVACMVCSCSKSDKTPPAPPFGVSADLNGAPVSFNAIITVDSVTSPGTVYIVAHNDSANLTPLFELTLTGRRPLKPGTYISPDSSGGTYSGMGYTAWLGGSAIQYPSVSDTVTLATVNNTWLSGTFQGTCEYSADSVISVTNGKFAVGWNQR